MSINHEDHLPPRTPEQIAIQSAIRLGALLLFVYVSLAIVRPFAGILVWTIILTVATHPVYLWLKARFGGRGKLAAALLTVVLMVLLIGPIGALSSSLVITLEQLAVSVRDGGISLPDLPTQVTALPVVGSFLDKNWTLSGTDLHGLFKQYGHTLVRPGQWLLEAVERLAKGISVFAVAVIATGFLQEAAPALGAYTRKMALRVAGPRGTTFVDLAIVTIPNVAQGIIGIAVMQAIAIGLALLLTGVPHAGLLAAVALVLAISQIGAIVLIAPLVIWVWITKDWMAALPFTLAMVPTYALESIGKPMIMSRGLDTPMIVILIGVLGGAIVYGLPGLFIGPIVLAVFYELVLWWVDSDAQKDQN